VLAGLDCVGVGFVVGSKVALKFGRLHFIELAVVSDATTLDPRFGLRSAFEHFRGDHPSISVVLELLMLRTSYRKSL
jgi:hypothetical protein